MKTKQKPIRIGNHTIETDAYNFIVRKIGINNSKKSKNYGEEYVQYTTYHCTLRQAVDKMLTNEENENLGDVGLILSSHELILSKLDELIKLQKQ